MRILLSQTSKQVRCILGLDFDFFYSLQKNSPCQQEINTNLLRMFWMWSVKSWLCCLEFCFLPPVRVYGLLYSKLQGIILTDHDLSSVFHALLGRVLEYWVSSDILFEVCRIADYKLWEVKKTLNFHHVYQQVVHLPWNCIAHTDIVNVLSSCLFQVWCVSYFL